MNVCDILKNTMSCQVPGEPASWSQEQEHRTRTTRRTRINVEDLENWAQQIDVVASGYLVASVASPASIRSAMRLVLAYVKLIPVDCAPPRGSDGMQNFIRFLHAN